MTLYVFLLFLCSLFLLCAKDDLFPEVVINTSVALENKKFWTIGKFKWFIFCLCCSADFSALIEAVVNIPEESLPSRQKKIGISKK